MKSVLLIGLGRFGKHMAQKLGELKNEVLVVDIREDRVDEVLPFVTDAKIGDASNENFIASLGVGNFDLCVVAMENDFLHSLETTSLLKEHGASFVLATSSMDVHTKFLLRNGADRVVSPEKDMALRLAVKYSANNIFDYIELTPDYSIYEIPVPKNWVGKSIIQLAVRTKYKISILATKENDQIMPLPRADHVFKDKETIIIMGHNYDVKALIN